MLYRHIWLFRPHIFTAFICCVRNLGEEDALRKLIISIRGHCDALIEAEKNGTEIPADAPKFDIPFDIVGQCVTYCNALYGAQPEALALSEIEARKLSFMSVRAFQAAMSALFRSFARPTPFDQEGECLNCWVSLCVFSLSQFVSCSAAFLFL